MVGQNLLKFFVIVPDSASPFSNHLGAVPSAPTIADITVTFLLYSFFVTVQIQVFVSLFSFFLYAQLGQEKSPNDKFLLYN